MAGGMKVAVLSAVGAGPWSWGAGGGGAVRLLLVLSGCLVCGSAGIDLNVVMLQESKVYYMNTSQQSCYKNVLIPKWHDIWTQIQIRVNSSKLVRVTQVENEEKLKELEQFSIWNFFSSFLKEKLNDTYVNVGLYSTKTCLKVEIIEEDTKYSVTVTRRFDPKLFLIFLLGLILFFCGDLLSRKMCNATEKTVPPRLLTEEEYRIQGEVETRKALEKLREYCNSPDCSAWKTVSRIQSPKRFADFVEGSFHLTPNEVSVHEQEYGLESIIAQDELYEETSSEEEDSDSRYPAITQQNSFLT
ncbi:PREDICTED: transmembrane protein 194A [Lipotes vexillifer]|uniref:Transmembrane protein 194A n=1 Tax=Lipotes vexillifer TaxID=118797 RepID=A0A340Y7X1_LIPVE|nr:PREDICTED: transmembrane protein 194A [Lipotes vexillifer]